MPSRAVTCFHILCVRTHIHAMKINYVAPLKNTAHLYILMHRWIKTELTWICNVHDKFFMSQHESMFLLQQFLLFSSQLHPSGLQTTEQSKCRKQSHFLFSRSNRGINLRMRFYFVNSLSRQSMSQEALILNLFWVCDQLIMALFGFFGVLLCPISLTVCAWLFEMRWN